jgi:hypothetical protein
MAHSYHHAVSSARTWGGKPEDYQAVHDWLEVNWTVKRVLRFCCVRSAQA